LKTAKQGKGFFPKDPRFRGCGSKPKNLRSNRRVAPCPQRRSCRILKDKCLQKPRNSKPRRNGSIWGGGRRKEKGKRGQKNRKNPIYLEGGKKKDQGEKHNREWEEIFPFGGRNKGIIIRKEAKGTSETCPARENRPCQTMPARGKYEQSRVLKQKKKKRTNVRLIKKEKGRLKRRKSAKTLLGEKKKGEKVGARKRWGGDTITILEKKGWAKSAEFFEGVFAASDVEEQRAFCQRKQERGKTLAEALWYRPRERKAG